MPALFQVLVYQGPGVAASSYSQTVSTLRAILTPFYTVSPITPQALLVEPWQDKCALLVLPGGRDTPYASSLAGKGDRLIREFVANGGSFLGICAGGYYGSDEVRFMMDSPVYKVHQYRDLKFWPGACEGLVFPGFVYESDEGARGVEITVNLVDFEKQLPPGSTAIPPLVTSLLYYNGGGSFLPPVTASPDSFALASYSSHPTKPTAGVFCKVGKGKASLWGIHPEYSLLQNPHRTVLTRLHPDLSQETIKQAEEQRLKLMTSILAILGISKPKDASLLQSEIPTHPLPQVLISNPLFPHGAPELISKLIPILSQSTHQSTSRLLEDSNDTFEFIPTSSIPSVSSAIAAVRSQKPTEEELDNMNTLLKRVLVVDSQIEQSSQWSRFFNLEAYFEALNEIRGRTGPAADGMKLGDVLFYGEAVSSTQTMLDKNSQLLLHLTPPVCSLATFQLAARGRSSNAWLSPLGCLQFSLVLSLPAALGPKVVFVQYLMAVAICEALDPTGDIGVAIKWPNDVYAVKKDGSNGGKGERVKLGGILVNSSWSGGEFKLVVGQGINILNALPTTSLAQLIEEYNTALPESSKGQKALPRPTMERALASIISKFDDIWQEFVREEGRFDTFRDRYLERWLHSDELITLETTTPPTPVRISTITLDHGMLRTIPVGGNTHSSSEYDRFSILPGGWGKSKEEFIDLQPDGNSFDIMKGLVRRKY